MRKILGFLVEENGQIKMLTAVAANIDILMEDNDFIKRPARMAEEEIAAATVFTPQFAITKPRMEKEAAVKDALNIIGVAQNIKGYKYIVRAAMKIFRSEEYLESMTKMLYPEIARDYNTQPARVERAIRHAIESVWGPTTVKRLNLEFGAHVDVGAPKMTNGQFLGMFIERLQAKYTLI